MYRIALYPVAALFFLCGCIPVTVTPMRTRIIPARSGNDTPVLVYLPGKGDSITVFEANGMPDSLAEYGIDPELVVCDAHFGYYMKRNLMERLSHDVINPAFSRGRHSVWFVGNSMGGLGSVLYAWKHPGTVKGVVLLGPYIGGKRVVGEVVESGGLNEWDPVVTDTADWQRQLWLWIKQCSAGDDTSCPSIYLGYGRDDRLAPAQELLARALPPERVVVLDGGHDWPVWRKAWGKLLRRGALR